MTVIHDFVTEQCFSICEILGRYKFKINLLKH